MFGSAKLDAIIHKTLMIIDNPVTIVIIVVAAVEVLRWIN